MAEANDGQAILRQNLADAGCSEEQVEAVLRCRAEGDWKGAACLLRRHRRELMKALHGDQFRVDCLDHLLYQLEQT